MSEEKDAFYLVRKGDVIGVYKSMSDIQRHFPSSVSTLVKPTCSAHYLSLAAHNIFTCFVFLYFGYQDYSKIIHFYFVLVMFSHVGIHVSNVPTGWHIRDL